MNHALAVLAAGLLAGGMSLRAGAQVVNPRVTTDSTIECSSAEAVVKQILKPGMTDEQKAIACWRFMLDHYYHWYPPKEEDAYQDVRDFAKAINSYGFGPCFVNAPVLTALWEAAGFETRCWTITGHTIPEVRYGGAWHMLDADARAWHRKADGQIASVDELSRDAKLFTEPKEKSDPYYPFAPPDVVAKPLEPWGPPGKIMDLYLSRNDNCAFNRRAVMGHPMHLTLRPGETIRLNRDNEGKWYPFGSMPPSATNSGPIDVSKTITYGNGRLTWRPNLAKLAPEQILWLGSSNVKLADGRLRQDKDGEPGVAVLRVWCPYVLVEAKAEFVFLPAPDAAGAISPIELSTDGGVAWSEVTDANLIEEKPGHGVRRADLSKRVAGRYEYLLRVTLDRTALASLALDNLFQLAPLSLPRLKPGTNKVTVFRGPDEGVVQRCLGPNKVAKERYVVESRNLEIPKSLAPKTWQEPAFAVYKLTAPAKLTALSLGANITFDPGPNQYVEILYSLDAGKNWTSAFQMTEATNRNHSQYEQDRFVKLENPAGSKEALVRFAMQRNSKYFGIPMIRLYGFYQQPQPEDARLHVTIGWQEKTGDRWTDRKHAVAVAKFPLDFDLVCGGESVRLSTLELSAP